MHLFYKLVDRVPVPCEWDDPTRFDRGWWRVGLNTLHGVTVSTVFLGLNHNHSEHGGPILFETMIFGGPLDQHQTRYETYAEAEQGHADMCLVAFGEP